MINRRYFMCAKVNWLDGKQSYSWHYQEATVKSLFPRDDVFNSMLGMVKAFAKDKGLSDEGIEITCFCRC